MIVCRSLLIPLRERFGGLLERFDLFTDDSTKTTKRSTHDLYKNDLSMVAPLIEGRFKLNRIFASDVPSLRKERVINMINTLVLKEALQLRGTMNTITESNAEASSTEQGTDTNDSPSTLTSFKRKRPFSGFEGQRTPAKEKRSCAIAAIENEISAFEKED